MASSPDYARSDFRPTASWENLRLRAAISRKVRVFFDERSFLEVETPLLSQDTVVDRHLDPLPVTLYPDPRRPDDGPTYFLQTSPEFGMKRLLASGAGPIYQICKVFRAAEHGKLHNVEFTMVEWYRPDDDLEQAIALLSDLAEAIFQRGPAERLSYGEAFERRLGLNPHRASEVELAEMASRQGLEVGPSWHNASCDDWLELLFSLLVQPHLGRERPTILHHFPASQAALARVTATDPPLAERFELFLDGVELANGYHELLDAEELARRNAAINEQRISDGKRALPEASRLLSAMRAGMPPCSGCALGLDRAVMLAAGASALREVMAFPIDRA